MKLQIALVAILLRSVQADMLNVQDDYFVDNNKGTNLRHLTTEQLALVGTLKGDKTDHVANNNKYGQLFGWATALSSQGDVLAVSAPGCTKKTDCVRVYKNTQNTSWEQMGVINNKVGGLDGSAIAMSGNGKILAVGYPEYDTSSAQNVGRVQVYKYQSDGKWVDFGNEIIGRSSEESVGGDNAQEDPGQAVTSLAISYNGLILAVGYTSKEKIIPGRVRVYKYDGATKKWVKLGKDVVGTGSLGNSISLNSKGNRMAIGAPHQSTTDLHDDTKTINGEVVVYDFDGEWRQVGGKITGYGGFDDYYRSYYDAEFGAAVAMSGNGECVATGTPMRLSNADGSGEVLLHRYQPSTNRWKLIVSHIPRRPGHFDDSGISVAISDDCRKLAVGYPHDDAKNGVDSGSVVVYEQDGNSWNKKTVHTLVGQSKRDQFGWSVSFSGDGSVLAVGSPYRSQNGKAEGEVRVYEFD